MISHTSRRPAPCALGPGYESIDLPLLGASIGACAGRSSGAARPALDSFIHSLADSLARPRRARVGAELAHCSRHMPLRRADL